MAMRTLVLQGSPHRAGDTAALVEAALTALGGAFDTLWAYRDGAHPCVDCRRCWREPGCIYDDALQRTLANLDAYDVILIASPIYFSELSGMLLAMASRLQQRYAGWTFRGESRPDRTRAGGILLAGGGDGSTKPALARAGTLLHMLDAEVLSSAVAHDTNRTPAREDATAMAAARALGEMLRTWRVSGSAHQ